MFDSHKICRKACFAILFFAGLFAVGCAPVNVVDHSRVCQGQSDIIQAVARINLKQQSIGPIRASGKCTLSSYDKKGKRNAESPDIQMLFVPPYKLYLHGSSFGQEIFKIGTNNDVFWFRSKQTDDYYYGRRQYAEKCTDNHLINPTTLLEALGIVSIDTSWKLKHVLGTDIFTKLSKEGRPIKRVHIHACDYSVVKIEYFDDFGRGIVTTDLSDYVVYSTDGGLTFPKKISIISHDLDSMTAEIKFANVKLLEPTQKQLDGFKLPSQVGFENIYELNSNCDFIRR